MPVEVGIDEKELAKAVAKLRGLAKEVGNKRTLKRILRKGAKPMAEKAKANANVSEKAHSRYKTPKITGKFKAPKGLGVIAETYEPGTLRKSIGVKSLRGFPNDVFVGIKGKRKKKGFPYYAHWVEFGTVHSDAHPYMRPALDSKKTQVADIIIQETAKVIERYAKKNAVK